MVYGDAEIFKDDTVQIRAAAKLDDLVNFIPARISALLLIAASLIGGKDYSAGNAFKIFKRE